MMRKVYSAMRTRAIILKKQNMGEYDQLISCYTEEFGKVTAIAKSVLKPSSIQAMHLDLFSLVEFDLISGRGMPIITGAQAEAVFPDLKVNLAQIAIAYFFAETADKLFFEYQKDEKLWRFFSNFLNELNRGKINVAEFFRTKQIEFLDILGYAPNLEECVFCFSKTQSKLVAYSIEEKGVICEECFLSGQRGIVLKNGNWHDSSVLGAMFERLAEKRIYSLSFINSVVE